MSRGWCTPVTRTIPDEVFYLEDNQAHERREFTRDYLECFIPECDSRALTTVSRGQHRDGFRHVVEGAGGHAPERLFHQQGKALIARWVQEQYPDVRVELEKEVAGGERRPDVLLTWPDGHRVAVEIQYSAEEGWLTRHRSYEALGIPDVWLLGHIKPHLRPARPAWDRPDVEGRIEFSGLPERMAAEGVPLLWINPVDELIGTAWVDMAAHRCQTYRCPYPEDRFSVPPGAEVPGAIAFFDTDRLADCTLTPDGLLSPKLLALNAARAAYRQALIAEQNRQAAALAAGRRRAEAAARNAGERAKNRAGWQGERDRIRVWVKQQRPVFARTWKASELRRKVLARYRTVPDVLAVTLPDAEAVFAHPEHWHSVLYGDLILGKQGRQFSVDDCFRVSGR